MNHPAYGIDMAAQWDEMRQCLAGAAVAELKIRHCALAVGVRWSYLRGDEPLKLFLAMDWDSLTELRGFGRLKSAKLIEIVRALVREDPAKLTEPTTPKSEKHRTETSSSGCLSQLGIPPETQIQWDEMRQGLAGTAVAELTLRDCAIAVGVSCSHLPGSMPLKFFLRRDWGSLRGMRGFGRLKSAKLMEIVRALAREDPAKLTEPTMPKSEKHRTETSISGYLSELSIPPETPADLLFLSSRARNLILREGKHTVRALLEYLAVTDANTLRRCDGIGRGTVSELYGLLTAVTTVRADRVRNFLPLRTKGFGLCFSAFAKRVLEQEDPQHWDALFVYFVNKASLQVAGQAINRTRERLRQIVSAFMRRVDRGLGYFPDEKNTLWDAWQKCENLALYLEDDLNGASKLLMAGVLGRIFAGSVEGKAILTYRKEIFDGWWKEVRDLPAFYFGGLAAAKFVRDKGERQFLQNFLDYLEGKPGVKVSRTAGKAFSSRYPLKRVVRAMVVSSKSAVNAGAILERLRSKGLCQDMDLEIFSRKFRHWLERGIIPAERVTWFESKRLFEIRKPASNV